MLDPKNKLVYVNEADPGAARLIELIRDGKTVVNAPRPFTADEYLDDITEFRHGRFYATGDREKWAKHWSDYDAWIVKVVSNEEIEALLIAEAENRDNPEKYVEIIRGLTPKRKQEYAHSLLSMPYWIG